VLELRRGHAGMSIGEGAPGPTFFRTPAELRRWFAHHHAKARELFVGYWKVGSGEPSITWPESVDEALCVGWIDGVRKRLDAQRYVIRFTPRKPTSVWSAVNIARVQALEAEGRMTEAGRAAFAARREYKSGIYSFEQRSVELPPAYAKLLKANRAAWRDFEARAPSYRKAVMWWIVSAKQEATRQRRLAQLIDLAARGQPIPAFSRP
jgi:uncharacterized protein YdeI (YjbR/CyaY-like superfamily)